MIRRAGRNVPWLDFLSFNRLTAHALFYCQKLLLLETAATKLNDFYGADGAEHGAADAEPAAGAKAPRARKTARAKGAEK